MKKLTVLAAFSIALGVSLSAQAPQAGPDLSGRWSREPGSGTAGPGTGGWGSRVEIEQSGVLVSVRPFPGKPEKFWLNGTETAEVLWVEGCKNQTRITKTQSGPDRVTITTWLVNKLGCWHREVEEEPEVDKPGEIEVGKVRGGPRRLESITVIFRNGDAMTVDTTRSTPAGPTSTTTIYRK